ncbi:LCP family protein [Streptomyces sp. NPDC017993]|uniref:LCP family protein n=1 Tax=Streptomyces sp. NPDC017993 TaxID=3365027 RepID=UPI0037A7549E
MTAPSRSPHPAQPGSPRTVPRRSAGQRRPPRRRWGLRICTVASMLLLVASGVGHAMVTGVEKGIGRVDAFKGMNNRPPTSTGGLNFLIVGTDGRDKLSKAQKRQYHLGGAPCHCTDTLMLVHLSADRNRASVISLPRDSYAVVPEHQDATGKRRPRHPVKLNAAYAEGGANLTVRTVEHMTGVHIDHYLEVDFTSFMRSVDSVGGVEICTVRPLKDSYTGLDLPVGRSRLNGGQALQYVRSRHIDGSADLGRMRRQQRFLAALIHQTTSSGVLMNPIRFKEVADTMLESVRADGSFGANDMVDLGQAMRGFTASSSEFTSVPLRSVSLKVPGLGETVQWDPVKSRKLFQAIRDDRPLAVRSAKPKSDAKVVEVPPAQIQVHVTNGTRRAGLGNAVDGALRASGFATTGAPGNGTGGALARTLITYDPRWDRSARSLAAALPGAELRPVPNQGAVMQVTVGGNHKAVQQVRAEVSPQNSGDFSAITGDQAVCP